MKLRILMFEDSEDWKGSFERLLKRRLSKKEITFDLTHKLNIETVMQDLQFPQDIILVDFDLGTSSGEDVLHQINGDPDFKSCKIFFYSGGVTVEELRGIAQNYDGGYIRCSTKDDLEEAIAKLYHC